jgi:hypothetical protein
MGTFPSCKGGDEGVGKRNRKKPKITRTISKLIMFNIDQISEKGT